VAHRILLPCHAPGRPHHQKSLGVNAVLLMQGGPPQLQGPDSITYLIQNNKTGLSPAANPSSSCFTRSLPCPRRRQAELLHNPQLRLTSNLSHTGWIGCSESIQCMNMLCLTMTLYAQPVIHTSTPLPQPCSERR
jgi:hypothetical protein